jgi:hypothetical protein
MKSYILCMHSLMCISIFWSAWCRLVKVGPSTRESIRISFTLLGVAALVLGVAPWAPLLWPWFPHYDIHPAVLLLLAANTGVLLAMAHNWRHPVNFNKPRATQ